MFFEELRLQTVNARFCESEHRKRKSRSRRKRKEVKKSVEINE
jgi:hypothetical protein